MTSCSFIVNTSSHRTMDVVAVAPVVADLDISLNKITYMYHPIPSRIKIVGIDNVINTAVAEALKANGDADVLVGLQTQIKYEGTDIESVVVTGYPAKYKSFLTVGDGITPGDLKACGGTNEQKRGK